jgi:hypothetical protein
MTLADLFEQLTYGELSSLELGDPSAGGIQKDSYDRVISHVNAAMKALYTRFWLKSGELIVELYDHIQTYTLDSDHAVTNKLSAAIPKYIIDSEWDPFRSEMLIKIEQVFNEGGELCFLNDITEPWSVFTPAYNQVQIPFPEKHNSLLIQYRQAPEKILLEPDQDPASVIIDLPTSLHEALTMYIGHRAFRSLNSDQKQEGNDYMQLYEQACQRAELAGGFISTNTGNERLDQNGWV